MLALFLRVPSKHSVLAMLTFIRNVYILLTILSTLPVSTATSEHSCSTMRRLKTHLRSTIENERMTGLALLSIHKDREIDREKIMNDFVASSNRRSDFVL